MANTFPIGPRRIVNSGDSGNRLLLANVDDTVRMGVWVLHIVDQGDKAAAPFNGTLLVRARSLVDEAQTNSSSGASGLSGTIGDDAPFVSIPFRALYLNGAELAAPMDVPAGTYITGTSIIAVPASGMMIGIEVTCVSGSVIVYRKPILGAGLPF